MPSDVCVKPSYSNAKGNWLTASSNREQVSLTASVAIHSTATGCANVGIDIDKDLSGEEHYSGRANRDADGNYYIMDLDDTYVWDGGYAWGEGYIWGEG